MRSESPLPVEGSLLCTFDRHGDARGFFNELFNAEKYEPLRSKEWRQVSFSKSAKHVLRGLHCSPYGKFVTCVRGAFYDVIADVRPDSPTFGRWCRVLLTEDNCRQVYVPAGCGHGFYTLEDDTDALYLQEGCFHPVDERDTHPYDPFLAVAWPLAPDETTPPTLSTKDTNAPHLSARVVVPERPRRRILVIGATGQIGDALLAEFGPENCIGTFCSSATPSPGMMRYDMTRATEDGYTELLFEACAPTHVFVCAGFTRVDACESEREQCDALNHTGPAHVARVAARYGCKPVWFSTDYVFDGGDGPYDEDAAPNPINEYGRAKLRGERAVLAAHDEALVLRVNMVYGPEATRKNFVHQVLDGRAARVAEDQYATPTHNGDIATACARLIDAEARGIVHVSGPDVLSRKQVVQTLQKEREAPTGVEFVRTSDLSQAASRPLRGGLKNGRIHELLPGWSPRDFSAGVLA